MSTNSLTARLPLQRSQPEPPSAVAVRIPAADDYPLAADLYLSSNWNDTAVIINSAMGVPRRYYRRFAAYLAAHGFHVVSYDYRGIGGSAPRRLRGFAARAQDWGRQDLEGILAWVEHQWQPRRRVVIGHSIGGQLIGLAPRADSLDGIVLVASQAGAWKHWRGLPRVGMFALWHLALPALVATTGMLPMKVFGQGENVPAGVAREWARWGRSPGYLFDPRHDLDTSRYARLALPLLAYSFADDGYAPEGSVEALLRRYQAAALTRRHCDAAEVKARPVGHFGFFQEGVAPDLWEETRAFLEKL